MIGIPLCLIAFAVTCALAVRSLGSGLVSLLAVGYVYGIVRARIGDIGSHFLFDAALLGFYTGGFSRTMDEAIKVRSRTAMAWAVLLMAWPFVCMAYSPLISDAQPVLIQLVGVRDALMMLPCMILGARLTREDVDQLAPALAILNVVALAFAILEYVYGLEAFYPRSAATSLIYLSMDINTEGGSFYRLPGTFPHAHAYGGTVVMSLPFVAHGLESGRNVRILSWAGLGAAVMGTFLCGARLPVVMLLLATAYAISTQRIRVSTFFAFGMAGAIVAFFVANFERFQRFTTLSDTQMVRERVSMSVTMSFFDILTSYPFGAGLASAFGTSIPYFLQDTPGVHSQIGLESEFARILLEEGVIGAAVWAVLAVYSSFRKQRVEITSPAAGAYLKALVPLIWMSGLLGTGVLSAIPTSVLIFIALGVRVAEPASATKPLQGFVPPRQAILRRAETVGSLAVGRASR